MGPGCPCFTIPSTTQVDADIDVIKPVLACIAERYDEYDDSGSDAWDFTLDVKKRPDFLRAHRALKPEPTV